MSAHAVTSHSDSRLASTAVLAGVLALAAAGWIVLVDRMPAMAMGPAGGTGGLGSAGWFAVTWVVMTAAMMLPGTAPAVVRAARARSVPTVTASAFIGAYGTVWLLAGLAGYACVQAVGALGLSAPSGTSAGRLLEAAAVLGAGLYQLTPAKRRWLERCTAPDRALPRRDPGGALRAGARHGVCCVACCGTLMIALYALGIMSITWMVVLTVLIAGERLAARRPVAVAAVAVVLMAIALEIAVT